MLNLRSQTLTRLELVSLPSEVSTFDIVLNSSSIRILDKLDDTLAYKTSNGSTISVVKNGASSFTFTTQDGVKHDATKWFTYKGYNTLVDIMTQAKTAGVARGIDAVLFDTFVNIVDTLKLSHEDFLNSFSIDTNVADKLSVVKVNDANYMVSSYRKYDDGEIDVNIYPIKTLKDFNQYEFSRGLRRSNHANNTALDYIYRSLIPLSFVVDKVLVKQERSNSHVRSNDKKDYAILDLDYSSKYMLPTDYLDSIGLRYDHCIYSGDVVVSRSNFINFNITDRLTGDVFGNVFPSIGELHLSERVFYRNIDSLDCDECGNSTEVIESDFFYGVLDLIESDDERDTFKDIIQDRYKLSDDYNNYCSNCQDNHEHFSDTLSRSGIRLRGDMIIGSSGKEYNYYDGHGIDSYDYKPDFHLYHLQDESDSDLHLGAEIEIDKGGENHNKSRALTAILGSDSYAMHDGSLSDGFEIATMPASLNYHMNYINYQDAFDAASKLGYRAHDTSTCGLHVHINRRFFGSAKATQNIKAAYMTLILERNWNEVVKFSRRDYHHIEEWADKRDLSDDLYSDDTDEDITRKFYDKYDAKYVAVNTQHSNSFEIRIFRGTLRYETYIATLQFVSNLAHIAKECTTLTRAQQITFDDIVNYKRHPELINYLATRGMQVESDILPVLEPEPQTPTLFDVVAA